MEGGTELASFGESPSAAAAAAARVKLWMGSWREGKGGEGQKLQPCRKYNREAQKGAPSPVGTAGSCLWQQLYVRYSSYGASTNNLTKVTRCKQPFVNRHILSPAFEA